MWYNRMNLPKPQQHTKGDGSLPRGFVGYCRLFTGGYVAGRKELVRASANRLGAPGVAGGATLGQNSNLFHVSRTDCLQSLRSSSRLTVVFAPELRWGIHMPTVEAWAFEALDPASVPRVWTAVNVARIFL